MFHASGRRPPVCRWHNRPNVQLVLRAGLSAIHVLTLALGLGAVIVRGRALAGSLDDAGWRRLLAADNLWGAPLPLFPIETYRRINAAETALVIIIIVFVAAFMARGVWMI
jgi:hypothetical protein